jgi:hypothetical protein
VIAKMALHFGNREDDTIFESLLLYSPFGAIMLQPRCLLNHDNVLASTMLPSFPSFPCGVSKGYGLGEYASNTVRVSVNLRLASKIGTGFLSMP